MDLHRPLTGSWYCEVSDWLIMMLFLCSCGHGWRSFRRSCWMMFMLSQLRRCRSWSNVSVSSSKPHCRSPSTSLKKGRILSSSSGTAQWESIGLVENDDADLLSWEFWHKHISCTSCNGLSIPLTSVALVTITNPADTICIFLNYLVILWNLLLYLDRKPFPVFQVLLIEQI